MSVRTHTPLPGYSVRPANLDAAERDALRGASGPGKREHRRRGEVPVLVVVALLLAFVIKTFIVQAFYIPSGSMIPTLEIGDRVLVEKLTYRAREPQRGEVIVFRRPGATEQDGGILGGVRSFLEGLGLAQPDEDIDLIKRIIALPGETVRLEAGQVYVNDVALSEPYARLDEDDFPPTAVPDGHYFMLGDNRGNSDDSRRSLGFVPRENIVGKAFVILWPPTHLDLFLDEDYPRAGEGSLAAGGLATRSRPVRGILGPPVARATGSWHPGMALAVCAPRCPDAASPAWHPLVRPTPPGARTP